MKHNWIYALVFVLAIGVLAACGMDKNKDKATGDKREELTIGTEATYPPFSFRDSESNEVTGYDVEIAREVAKRLGMKAKFVPTEWKGMFGALDTERIDMIANQVTITDDRKKKYAFSEPYTVSGGQVIVHEKTDDIKGIEDLKGKTVGTTQGSNYAEAAEEAGAKLKYYKGVAQVLTDLNVNRIDAALNDRLFIQQELKDNSYKVKPVGEPFNKNKMAFTFRKDQEDLVEKVNNALEEMKKDGTIEEISQKYFGEDVSE
ncbi:transporter substrate-binding domain-containing protein [Pseudalkalibacillus berkeleyi]|uniref:Transporter substrate-binding domain-containing protein n=1 Tax=Pseudalkalibacillus berkeleyi TaxID=1069813 RepID=A0ABS9GWX3_9BACL|nr:transporter substrate-binding domain-containing protein [Pseudalkalibacillus berkeleyi]MCF6136146.1 transporter substrate-binding domain-containing protein [Pseudalkalibacillus berkeleyi]